MTWTRCPMRTSPLAALLVAMNSLAWAGPVITSMDPTSGPAGTLIRLEGKDLKTTEHVLFAIGGTVTSARFRALREGALEVIAPEYYRQGAAGTVAVFTRFGVTVTMPSGARVVDRRQTWAVSTAHEPGLSFFQVRDGGICTDLRSPGLIDAGGEVNTATAIGFVFIKSGGLINRLDDHKMVAFYEPGARFGAFIRTRLTSVKSTLIPLDAAVTVSPGVGPFLFEAPERPHLVERKPTDAARAKEAHRGAPVIRSGSPWRAVAGEVITLKGHNLGRTTHVYFAKMIILLGPDLNEVAFRVVSDSELRVQVPDLEADLGAEQAVIVVTDDGATVTVPRDDLARNEREEWAATHRPLIMNNLYPVRWAGHGEKVVDSLLPVIYVDRGSSITNPAYGGAMLVKAGGHVFETRNGPNAAGGPALLIVEPGAQVPERYRSELVVREVPRIEPSFLPTSLSIDFGPPLLLKSGTPGFVAVDPRDLP